MTGRFTIPAFSAYGLELEYMIVDRTSLAVRPLADRLLQAFAGGPAASVAHGPLGWSNELVRHVIEVKNVEPTPALDALAKALQQEVARANVELVALDAQLMPTGMHPSMDPRVETELWTQDASEIYAAYDRIFGCRQHGFANLQSMHINLPFAGDAEFERLHAAVRLVLPFIPALAASSPLADGKLSGFLDYRLEVYRTNAGALSTIAGDIVPDTATGRAQYTEDVFAPMYREIEPHDPDGVLRHEWLNSRGAIPRFDRSAIEIRVADTQECPEADVAIAAVVTEVVHALYRGRWSSLGKQQSIPTPTLVAQLHDTIRRAEGAVVADRALLRVLGLRRESCTARDVWAYWVGAIDRRKQAWWRPAIDWILAEGTLATRIVRAVNGNYHPDRIRQVYSDLCRCLAVGRMMH